MPWQLGVQPLVQIQRHIRWNGCTACLLGMHGRLQQQFVHLEPLHVWRGLAIVIGVWLIRQVEVIEAAAEDLHQRCLELVDWIVREDQFAPFCLSDVAIAVYVVLGDVGAVPRLVDFATTAGLLGMGVLAVLAQRMTGQAGEEGADLPLAPSEDDHALFARLEELMAQRRLWRDPDVTLSMLARA